MSLIDAPLALIDRLVSRRTPSVQPDDPIARMVARTTARLRPDHLVEPCARLPRGSMP